MVTRQHFSEDSMRKNNSYFSALKATIETAFYENHVVPLKELAEAYRLAAKSPNTIVLDTPVAHAEDLGLPKDAKILLENSGGIVGRTAKARRIFGQDSKEDAKILQIIREAIFQARHRTFYRADAVVGLDEAFMLRAHLMVPQDDINNLYSWLNNFQVLNDTYRERLKKSKRYEETDIYIFSDPEWSHPDYPDGLVYFDTNHNCAAILGLHYFGELKKATLTLAWGTANRNKYVACHGGLKIFEKEGQKPYVTSFFGLSGSGKSTLTHAKHNGKYRIDVLHDDAFVISEEDGSTIALEPAYFDKTNDYPAGHREQKYFVAVQNCGAALDKEGHLRLVTEDIRNGNGRTIKSRFSTPNRVDRINHPIQSIFWIMKDDSLPPLIRVTDPIMASTMGCTLVTTRSTAENTTDSLDALIIEPYANPFRVYPLVEDYIKFQHLFESGVNCYIINTGSYLGQDIPKETTLDVIEQVVDGTAKFEPFGSVEGFEYLSSSHYKIPNFDKAYVKIIRQRMKIRLQYLEAFNRKNPKLSLPDEAISHLKDVLANLG
ncbi:phosphoenolpyruvate carboxykinase (ATP) [Streptococcus mutans]|uniref:phosphoenolpyruvate carboxykinase (ATP) n=1 Tax=Streptococcus mutans TaxID=1309 RepID=UPI0018AB5F48|nr:phosphoenolpyruvate carboxykinase (ATP) [Streptococcus mutans]MCB4961715.1 phosphoenolpyruvate carboxykinase (ATP) [Streptococcus mutans]MCB5010315.1 phosphoenolpyruvate carboxykinase (ATP) [Streptococcus mutans]MCB5157276.1 phosphoenolpyruvate carboxykinase (ATP) [Streptococcus mutans]MDB8633189.1 phosphoenolpyruvate carboxykinase (ATP) [Streptococcus mutans]MDT9508037.1 phosphoenolpyruvate carboxykinase (ATP) [Streptococcus mutans]